MKSWRKGIGGEDVCIYRKDDGLCKKYSTDVIISYCVNGPCTDEVLTNADRIRSMSDEELVGFLDDFSSECLSCARSGGNEYCKIYSGGRFCEPCDIMKWLKKPAIEK